MSEKCRLYLITPPKIELVTFAYTLASALDGGDAACLQLRLKDAEDATIRTAIETLMPICHERDVAFIVNDRPDLAAECGADGVHIGADDGEYETARELLGNEAAIGVSCYDSRHRAMEAGEAGADYVAFGAFYPTTSKTPRSRAEPEILDWWSELTIVQSVSIGGITADNCAPLVKAGTDFLAVIAAVWDHPGGAVAGVKAINDAIAEADTT